MAYVQFDDTQVPLRAGELTIGTGPDAAIRLPGAAQLGVVAILKMSADEQVVIRRAGDAASVKVNGVQLGAEPTPLIHGDKIEVAGQELQFGDERKAGGTQLISEVNIPGLGAARPAALAQPTAATGGRLVSLVDGREYPVPASGLTVGRDAGCDVVVPSGDVSRRHAEISGGERGYVVSDLSTNGVFVNGERVQRSQVLARGDVVRIGNEEFRFYADAAPSRSSPSAPSTATPPPPALIELPAPAAPAAPASAAAAAVAPLHAGAASGPHDTRPVLATLEIMNEGVNKGKRYDLRTPLVHVGRGAHNDVVIGDESVSDTHAKLQRREDGWVVVDMQSTNGTYVGGRRVSGEQRLSGSPDLRFGGIKMRFAPAATATDFAKETRAIAGMSVDQARKVSAQTQAEARARAEALEKEEEIASRSLPGWIWVLVVLAIGAAAFFILQGV